MMKNTPYKCIENKWAKSKLPPEESIIRQRFVCDDIRKFGIMNFGRGNSVNIGVSASSLRFPQPIISSNMGVNK